ncbi:MAG TPA: hypothetical protein PK280_11750 [Planctomycetota bacterium]|nr:hypothetical protein [Planctomycetota bacterium]
MRPILICATILNLAVAASAGESSFATRPSTAKDGDKVKITFALAAPTDVEVAVLGADGKVVRHLAAGVLGAKNPPPAPLKDGLAQELAWDGRDDFGKPAAGGPFKVRVRAGTRAAFDGFVCASPYALARIRGLAVDKAGCLYVLEQAYDSHFPGPYDIRVFDRTGRYLRNIMPFSAEMRKEDAAAFAAIEGPGGEVLPRNQYSVWPCLEPMDPLRGLKMSATLTPDGNLILHDEHCSQIGLLRAADGTVAGGKFLSSPWPTGVKVQRSGGSPVLALTPDGKTLYATAFAAAPPKGQRLHPDWPEGRVYKFEMDKLGQSGGKFADVELPEQLPGLDGGWTPAQATSALRGLAVDAKGSVYVCDAAAGKVHKLDAAGKETGAVEARFAHHAAVSPKDGALYVLTCASPGRKGEKKLIKFSGGESGAKRLAELDLGAAETSPILAGDFSGEKAVLWVAGAGPGGGLLRIEDGGAELKVLDDLCARADPLTSLGAVDKLTVDYATDDLYINSGWNRTARFNGITGKYTGPLKDGKPDHLVVTDTATSPDGYVYVQRGPSYSGPVERLDRELKPAPLAGGKSVLGSVYARYGAGYCEKGICVGWDGKLYVTGMYDWARYAIFAFGPDGAPLEGPCLVGGVKSKEAVSSGFKSCIAGPLYDRCGGLRIDQAGDLYFGAQVLPEGHARPAGFEKDQGYAEMVGSVIKIKPGAVLRDENRRTKSLAKFEGALTVYPELAPFSGWRRSDCCVCRTPRFDLDPYGRLVLPNAITCRVRVVDNAGNEILAFGGYGNFDSQYVPEGAKDAKPLVARPEVPLGWALGAGFSEKKIYVADLQNRRVVRMDIKHGSEETCEVK